MISLNNFNLKKHTYLLRASVYGANDGIVTTFAVVAGVAGAGLSANVVLILGVANMVADGLSMALGDFLGEKSERELKARNKGEDKCNCDGVWHSGLVTFISFVIAGTFPLLPYLLKTANFCNMCFDRQFALSAVFTALALFFVGSLRTIMIKGSIIKNGLEMLGIGAIAAVAAYVLGAGIEQLLIRG